jgi:ABC-type Zn uptake system ZnuABC Zn-binding protein ZnuA
MDKTIKNASTKAPVVVTTQGVTVLKGDENEPEGDPHLWFDPTLVKIMINNIASALAKADGANTATYQRNATAYNMLLDQLDQQVQNIFNQVPQEQRKLVTNHDAFQYLAKRYDLTIVGAVIPSLSDAAEPSAKDLNDLIATIRREQVKAIFAESSANAKVAQQVAKETGVRVVDNLYGDTLGPPGSDGDTYLRMMIYDATTITNAIR